MLTRSNVRGITSYVADLWSNALIEGLAWLNAGKYIHPQASTTQYSLLIVGIVSRQNGGS